MLTREKMIDEINALYNEIARLQCLLDDRSDRPTEDAISRQAVKDYCLKTADRYRKRAEYIRAQGDAIFYNPEQQLEAFDTEVLIYESFAREIDEIPSVVAEQVTVKLADEDIAKVSALMHTTKDGEIKLDRPKGEWISCAEPPNTNRNVFIAYGTENMKSVCIGHYEQDLKQWYEDKNFFASPIYDGMYWCEIPSFPTEPKEDISRAEEWYTFQDDAEYRDRWQTEPKDDTNCTEIPND